MEITIYRINDNGVEKIRQFLLANHKLPQEATTDRALSAWVMDAEISIDFMGIACIEIPTEYSIHGRAVELLLDETCVDVDVLSDER